MNLKKIIVGDLNARHKNWGNHTNNMNEYPLNEFIDNTNKVLYAPNRPIRYSPDGITKSTIDLIITKGISIHNLEICELAWVQKRDLRLERHIQTEQKLDETITTFTYVIKTVINNNIPIMNQKIALPDEIIQEITIKNKKRREYQRHLTNRYRLDI